ncbi:MAG: Permease of the drug/metabolite transporter (DMT) superfamily [Firmicutes bacterium]|nr:Permease of the drug/metabolite transporter (DMT) superfamily [Bacillota bacterium]MDI6707163.1 EamA family transporter [Bacillota bacterium]
MNKEERKVVLAFIAVCIIWGSTYLAIRIGVQEFPPGLFAGIRFLAAGLIMLTYARLKGHEFPSKASDIRKISIVGLFLLFGGNGMVVWAEQWVHSGIASLLVATGPLFMAILEFLLPNTPKIKTKGWIGLLLGISGVILLVSSNLTAGTINLKGALLMVFATLSWSTGSIYSKTFKASGSIVPQIGIQMVVGGTALTVLGLIMGEHSRAHLTFNSFAAMLYLILFGSILGYSSYIYVLQKWPAAKAGTYAYVNPIVAVFLGAIVLNEPITIYVVISSVIILTGVFLVQTSKTQIKPAKAKIPATSGVSEEV